MIPSTRKIWKFLDIQVFTFSDLETNVMAVVYSINQKGTTIPLIFIQVKLLIPVRSTVYLDLSKYELSSIQFTNADFT